MFWPREGMNSTCCQAGHASIKSLLKTILLHYFPSNVITIKGGGGTFVGLLRHYNSIEFQASCTVLCDLILREFF